MISDLGFDFSVSGLIASFVFGVIGLYLFRYARKRGHTPTVWIGVALMIYPYFTKGAWLDWGVGIALCALAYYVW